MALIWPHLQAQAQTGELIRTLWEKIKKFESFSLNCVSRAENKEATDLAMQAAEQAPTSKRRSELDQDTRTKCLICLEKLFPSDLVSQKGCCHEFCFDCISQHVETQISISKVPVRCPQVDCAQHMDDLECKRLTCPKVYETYLTRLTEATISNLDKVYCPFQGCSAMMCTSYETNSADGFAASSSTSTTPGRANIGSAECMECHRLFCVECCVPWHADLTCKQYQELPPDERDAEDRKLFKLAAEQKWRRCGKCKSVITLREGCFHMTCR